MDFHPHVTHSPNADALYVCLSDAEVERTRSLGDWRNVDLAADGSVVGVEFLGVSGGVDLNGVPERHQIEGLLKGLDLRVLA